jgi:adenylate cyclase
VLVADIRNFSAFAAHRPAAETAALLHAYYCLAVDVIEEHGGVVENVAGDAITAVWNAYADDGAGDGAEHPQRAYDAARELVRATRALLANPVLSDKDPRVQPLALGVGLETGPAIVGSFGPARRRAHAALGEPVGVASRLQQMTQDLSMPVLLGPTMARRLPVALTECLGDYLLEGMGLQCALFVPADWAELVPCEQLWAAVTQPGTNDPAPADDERGPAAASADRPPPQAPFSMARRPGSPT